MVVADFNWKFSLTGYLEFSIYLMDRQEKKKVTLQIKKINKHKVL